MIFKCGQCNTRQEIVGFKPDGYVPGVIGIKQSIPLCFECKSANIAEKNAATVADNQPRVTAYDNQPF